MINIEHRHLQILKKILAKYDCSFFLFGSRISKNAKKFSDIDLLYFETLQNNILLRLEEELEESDLPYKVDLIAYNQCDNNFKKIIDCNYVCIQTSSKLQSIEQNHLKHFEFLPKRLGFDVSETEGLRIINCRLESSMFNIVYGVPYANYSTDFLITKIKDKFKKQAFAWWIPPSLWSSELSQALVKAGFMIENSEHAMICELENLSSLEQTTDLVVKPVLDEDLLEDFIMVLESYDHSVRRFYEMINSVHLRSLCEKLFIGYANGSAVIIATLFNNVSASGIFTLLTREEVQSKGYGTDMMRYLLRVAKDLGSSYATLSASSNSGYRIYERLGFYKIGEFKCFEYKWS